VLHLHLVIRDRTDHWDPHRNEELMDNKMRAILLAAELIAEHCPGYTVEVNSALTSTAGRCWHGVDDKPGKIELAEWLLLRAPWEQVEETVRHEIAHAVAGHAAGHTGWRWFEACRKLGCKPTRCYDGSLLALTPAAAEPPKYTATCCETYTAKKLGRAMQEGRTLCRCGKTLTWYYA
jgi:predicted SprT family Zn-dependent metalloprotease